MNTRRFLIIGVCALTSALAINFLARQVRMSGGITGHTISPAPKISAAARSLRPNYPYSVIPGGAYSPAELRFVNQKDSLVRDHYADFNMKDAQLVMLTEDRYQYASFRLKNRIFWTHKKLRIPKGEILLTDGHNYARTRCGNRLSSTPKPNTTPLEPPAGLLSLPPFSPKLLSEIPPAPVPPIGELAQQYPVLPFYVPGPALLIPPGTPAENWPPIYNFPPIVPITPGYIPTPPRNPPGTPGSPPVVPPTTPPVISQVPEPATLYLFGITLCISLWLLARVMRARRNPGESSKEGES